MLLQLYLHFPFCKRKCLYCDFCSSAQSAETIAAYCFALKNNLFTMGKKYAGAKVSTVFLGGGTPSWVSAKDMAGVLDALRSSFDLLPDAEVTSEANPGTLSAEWLDMAVEHGLNRLSLGVQASQDPLLRTIGRIHTFEEARQAVRLAKSCGIPVVLLCQLNRDSAKDEKEPQLYHLRDSGSIEQDADIVLMLERDKNKEDGINIYVRKNRQGRCETFQVVHDEYYANFYEPEKDQF